MSNRRDTNIPQARKSRFYFKKPSPISHLSPEANLVISMAGMASRLVYEERTLCVHNDGRSENVAEHSFMLAKVAVELARQFYPELDPGKVALAAICHDDLEAYVGDTPTLNISNKSLEQKYKREAEGLQALRDDYIGEAPKYVEDLEVYEAQKDPHVRFVRVVDKLMVLLIHIPNQGLILREHFSKESYAKHTAKVNDRLSVQYPEFSDLIDLKRELEKYISDTYH